MAASAMLCQMKNSLSIVQSIYLAGAGTSPNITANKVKRAGREQSSLVAMVKIVANLAKYSLFFCVHYPIFKVKIAQFPSI